MSNLLLHTANSLLIFAFWRRTTGAFWSSALVAALFALHPLHVESVAWASERKDVLSTFFFLLMLLAYGAYVCSRRGDDDTVQGQGRGLSNGLVTNGPPPLRGAMWYGLALFWFALGLMSKPMLVTAPFVLLLLDWWPFLRHAEHHLPSEVSDFKKPLRDLLLEKVPFFALAFAASIITYRVQKAAGAVWPVHTAGFPARMENALVSYARYLGKTVWPVKLAILYPYRTHWPELTVVGAVVLLAVISGLCFWLARRHPAPAVGWLWFLGTLVPVIGLIQVGSQAMADRYLYIPSIGLFVSLVWTWKLLGWGKRLPALATSLSLVVLGLCFFVSRTQLQYWQNSETLFRHSLKVTGENFVACDSLGKALDDSGRLTEALPLYQRAVELEPNSAHAQYLLGTLLWKLNRDGDALAHLARAVHLDPHDAEAQYNFGSFLLSQGEVTNAVAHLGAAVCIRDDFVEAQNNLGDALSRAGDLAGAELHLRRALELSSDSAQAHCNLGTVLVAERKTAAAIGEFVTAIRLQPNFAEAHRDLGATLAMMGHANEALPHLREAARLEPNDAEAHFNLGLAWADTGNPHEAAQEFADAVRLNPKEARYHYRLALADSQNGQVAHAILEAAKAIECARVQHLPEIEAEATALSNHLR